MALKNVVIVCLSINCPLAPDVPLKTSWSCEPDPVVISPVPRCFVSQRGEFSPVSVRHALLVSEVFSQHVGCLKPFTLVRSVAPCIPVQSCF